MLGNSLNGSFDTYPKICVPFSGNEIYFRFYGLLPVKNCLFYVKSPIRYIEKMRPYWVNFKVVYGQPRSKIGNDCRPLVLVLSESKRVNYLN